MDEEIYENVKDLVIEMTNASGIEDRRTYWELYQKLENICLENENKDKDHPFQWETLADFTDDPNQAIKLYEKAYAKAEANDLKEYAASIYLALAERYLQLGDPVRALEKGQTANELAKNLNDLELRREISNFLLHEL